MAEEKEPQTSSPSAEEEKEEKTEKSKEALIYGRFKTQEEFEKSYGELERKLGEQGSELGTVRKEIDEARKYQIALQPVVNLIDQDLELRKRVFAKLGVTEEGASAKQVSKSEDMSTLAREAVQREVAPLRQLQEGKIFEEFEKKYGIDQLESEKRKDLRTKIGAYLGKYVPGGIKTLPLNLLSDFLNDAYFLVNKDRLTEQGKLEGRVAEREAQAGAIGSIASGEAKVSPTQLTPKQRETAKKAGIAEKDYAEALEKIESESEGGK